ncbi:hypothetical protein [Holdemania sp. Marseille-P2844]|nr:hypothetical protein [Holdemania sp. Marseille-P2844]
MKLLTCVDYSTRKNGYRFFQKRTIVSAVRAITPAMPAPSISVNSGRFLR